MEAGIPHVQMELFLQYGVVTGLRYCPIHWLKHLSLASIDCCLLGAVFARSDRILRRLFARLPSAFILR